MYFSEEHLHEALKLCLDTLCEVVIKSDDLNIRGNAAINLANIILEIHDRQNEEPAFDFLDEEEDDFNEEI